MATAKAARARAMKAPAPIDIHQWTHTGDDVLIVKCVGAGGVTYGDFVWPLTVGAEVIAPDWRADAECGGGLHGWPWGLSIGDGKEPDWSAPPWLVFAAKPTDVVDLGGKVKARCGRVVYVGDWQGATNHVLSGQIAWVLQRTANAAKRSKAERGAASATGERGAASATGWSGAASATGERGAASATGWKGAASATGVRGAASATGERGAASATGLSGAASATGWRGIASLSGKLGQIEVGPHALGAVTANEWYWVVNKGSVVACRWSVDDVWHHRLLLGDDQDVEDGTIIKVVDGQPQTEAASS